MCRDCIQPTLSLVSDVTTLEESAVLDAAWLSKALHQALPDFGSKHQYLGDCLFILLIKK